MQLMMLLAVYPRGYGSDNSDQVDKTTGVMNLMVVTGKLGKNGKLKLRNPVQTYQLPNLPFPINSNIFDCAITINRTNKNNIIVSYSYYNCYISHYELYCNQFVAQFHSTEVKHGLKHLLVLTLLPFNGPTNLQPTGYVIPGMLVEAGRTRASIGQIWKHLDRRY